MKRTQKILLAFAVLMSCGIYSASAQIFVKVRPPVPPHIRVVAPSPQHVWIEEDWQEHEGRYESHGGRWAEPPHHGDRYKPGHWDHSSHGHSWKQGRWEEERGNRGHGREEHEHGGHGHEKHGRD